MKKVFVLCFVLILFSNNVFALAEDNEGELEVNAQAAILMDFSTKRVLWEKNSNEPMAMASTTKIMTAITAIENADLNDIVKVSKKASLTPPVKMHLKENEEIKLEYLLYSLMMQSSNDAAVAIAEHVGGSVDEFCNIMTENARKLGAKDTVFRTPNGLDSQDHHSTAYDMALITRYAMSNKTFMKIINTKEITFNSNSTTYSVINKNRLLSEFEGANGVKTGYTGKAGQCFVGAAERNGMQLISVVLASGWGDKGKEQKWIDSKKILTYGFDNFKYKQLVKKNTKASDVDVDKSKTNNIEIFFNDNFIYPLKEGEENKIDIRIKKPNIVEAPIVIGDKVGEAEIYFDGQLCKTISLVSNDMAERHDFNTSLKKIINYWISITSKCVIQ